MKFTYFFTILLAAFASFSSTAYAYSPSVSPYTLGKTLSVTDTDTEFSLPANFLYLQNIGADYHDVWFGQAFQNLVKVQSEGKVGLFIGILQLNCKNQTSIWVKVVDRTDESKTALSKQDIDKAIPAQVAKNAVIWYCKT